MAKTRLQTSFLAAGCCDHHRALSPKGLDPDPPTSCRYCSAGRSSPPGSALNQVKRAPSSEGSQARARKAW